MHKYSWALLAIGLLTSGAGVDHVGATRCPDKTCESAIDDDLAQEPLSLHVPTSLSDVTGYAIADGTLQNLLNEQVHQELQAFYTYVSLAAYFDRDDIALPGFQKLFIKASQEELQHANQFMAYMNKRGLAVWLWNLTVPCEQDFLKQTAANIENINNRDCKFHQAKVIRQRHAKGGVLCDWQDPLTAVIAARHLEINVYKHLTKVQLAADKTRDAALLDFMDDFLKEQVDSIKELSDLMTQLRRVEPCVGYHLLDRELSQRLAK